MKPGELAALDRVLDGCGWSELGGRLIRAGGCEGPVIGRTSWIPRERWWNERPEGLTERRCRRVVADALEGKRLGPRQRRYLIWLVELARREARGELRGNADGECEFTSEP